MASGKPDAMTKHFIGLQMPGKDLNGMIRTNYGEGKYAVCMEVHETNGAGLVAFVYGGEFPHLGGVVLATPGRILHGSILSHCDIWSMTVPGHKDANLAQALAKKLCMATNEAVSVSLGIHIENASGEEIKTVCNNAEAAADLFLEAYHEKGGGHDR